MKECQKMWETTLEIIKSKKYKNPIIIILKSIDRGIMNILC
jgi:hypothetical protein